MHAGVHGGFTILLSTNLNSILMHLQQFVLLQAAPRP